MTSVAVAEGLVGVGLADHEREREGDGRPDGHAQNQADEQPDVEVIASVVGTRLQDVTLLSILAARRSCHGSRR